MVRVAETVLLHKVTGQGSINETDTAFGIHGTDLGFMWDAGPGADGRDRVFAMFGDTYGQGWGGFGAGPKDADWRTNTLLASTNTDLDRGLLFDRGLTRRTRGGAAQVIRRNRLNVPTKEFPEHTLIPNSGITVDGVHFVHWMSVLVWRPGGRWRTFQSGIAVSHDDARTWQKPLTGRWPNVTGQQRFQIGAFARDEQWVYLAGTTNGRWGPAYLARVRPDAVGRARAYQYWDGQGWHGRPGQAAPIFAGPVGELSLGLHEGLGCWVAMHLDEQRSAIVIRYAPEITGPWTDGEVVADSATYPMLYGGFMHPWGMSRDTIHWAMSQWAPYNVFWMRTTFER